MTTTTWAQIGKQIQCARGAAKTITRESTDENKYADNNTTINKKVINKFNILTTSTNDGVATNAPTQQ
jgi:hypothetical protein